MWGSGGENTHVLNVVANVESFEEGSR